MATKIYTAKGQAPGMLTHDWQEVGNSHAAQHRDYLYWWLERCGDCGAERHGEYLAGDSIRYRWAEGSGGPCRKPAVA